MMIRWRNRWRKALLVFGVAVSLVFVFAGYVFFFPNYSADPKGSLVTIPRGASFRSATDSLVATGAIRNRWSFQLAGRVLGHTKSIKHGKYLFVSGLSNYDILKDVITGRSRVIIPVTLPEGWRMDKIAHRFEHDLGIDAGEFLSLCRDFKFIHDHGIRDTTLEGYILPETYSFYWQTDEKEIIGRILDGFHQFYCDSLIERQNELGKTQHEVLTLASIVEAESNVPEERPMIAGVYLNRLRKNMRREADPTVQYALGVERRLNFQDLEVNSPYNTYRHSGLPPGPINNPGKSSILAALYPETHEYLFFVATGTGGHHFARNFGEHKKNIRTYHRARRGQKQIPHQNG